MTRADDDDEEDAADDDDEECPDMLVDDEPDEVEEPPKPVRASSSKRPVEDDYPLSLRAQLKAQRLVDTPKRQAESRRGSKSLSSRQGTKEAVYHPDAKDAQTGPATQAVLGDLTSSQLRDRSRSKEALAATAFMAERVAISKDVKGNRRKQLSGKTLRYDNLSQEHQKGLDASRATEWKKWMDFGAGVKVQGEILDELIGEGHRPIPMQWIDTDQNEHLIRPGTKHVPKFKSRLVGCGQFEDRTGIRSDSPTCDVEGLNLVCSFAACNKLQLKCSDLRNAYFNGLPLDRLLLMWPPKGGLPGEGDDKYAIASNLPIYGTGDAGRRFYKAFRQKTLDVGMYENEIMKSLYSFHIDGEVMLILAVHVDDILCAAKPEYEHMVEELLAKFEIKETKVGQVRFCGREYTQGDDFSIKVTAKDNTEKTLPISFTQGSRKDNDKATTSEVSQLRSVNGSLGWIARQVRPEKCYVCSKLQSIVNVAEVQHLAVANRLLQEIKDSCDQGLFFKSVRSSLTRPLC